MLQARAKRKAPIVESDVSGTEDEGPKPSAAKEGKPTLKKKARKSQVSSDDDFEFDEDDEDLIGA